MKPPQLLLPWLAALGAVTAQSQISKKPDASPPVLPSAQQSNVGEYQYSTLLTSMIRQPDLILHDIDAATDNQDELDTADSDSDFDFDSDDSDSELAADGQTEMFDADSESDDDESELAAFGSINGHPKKKHGDDDDDDPDDKEEKKEEKEEKKDAKKNAPRVKWYKKVSCKSKSHRSNKHMILDTCQRLHKPSAYKLVGKKKQASKKHNKEDDDDDDDDDTEAGSNCTMIFYSDKKCQTQVWKHSSSMDAPQTSCVNIGRTEDHDVETHKEKGKPSRQVWSAMLTCKDEDSSGSSDSVSSSQYGSMSKPTGASKTASSVSSKATGTKKASKTGTKKATKTSYDDDDDEDEESDDDDDDDDKDDKEAAAAATT